MKMSPGSKMHLLTFLIGVAVSVGSVWVMDTLSKPQRDNERFLAIENQVASIGATVGRLETASDKLGDAINSFKDGINRLGVIENDLTRAKSDIERLQFADSNQNTRIELVNSGMAATLSTMQRQLGRIEGRLGIVPPEGNAMLKPAKEFAVQ